MKKSKILQILIPKNADFTITDKDKQEKWETAKKWSFVYNLSQIINNKE